MMFIFRVDRIELGKIRVIILVFFQVGVLDTSKYSTWKVSKLETQRKRGNKSEKGISFDQSEKLLSRICHVTLKKLIKKEKIWSRELHFSS